MKQILAIYRAGIFSPNSEEKDRAILETVILNLRNRGYSTRTIKEEDLTSSEQSNIIITMGRHKRTLKILKGHEDKGSLIINSPTSIKACARATIDRTMRNNGIPTAPLDGSDGYWIKRGDEAAQSKEDVIFAANETARDVEIEKFKARGITETVVTAHIKGDLVKFYGIHNTGFFKTFYPSDDGISKFGDELLNGLSLHYKFSKSNLHLDAERVAELTGIEIYGGDCIIREDGSYAIIDFNDWPSFSRCREEAAGAIAERIDELIHSYKSYKR